MTNCGSFGTTPVFLASTEFAVLTTRVKGKKTVVNYHEFNLLYTLSELEANSVYLFESSVEENAGKIDGKHRSR